MDEQAEQDIAASQDTQAITAEDSGDIKSKGAAEKVAFDRNFTINFAKELPELSPPGVMAYDVVATGNQSGAFFAIISEPHLTPRVTVAQNYVGIVNPAAVRLVAAGVVPVPMVRQQRYCFIYENTLGGRLIQPGQSVALGWKPEFVLEAVLTPAMNVLKDFYNMDMVHGAICPSNMYNGGKEQFQSIILGDCLSVPAFSRQRAVFETPDRMLATPTGRGETTPQNDLYSLGVSIAMMLRTIDPMENMTDEQIYTRKIQQGSYVSLFSKVDRFSGAILELLRGLLQDDPASRWTVDEALAWMDGRRLSPKQSAKAKRAGRTLSMNNHDYNYTQTFVRDIHKNQTDAVQIIENGTLEQWIQRSLADEALLKRFEEACSSAKEQGVGAGYHERLMARVGIALDPNGPIRQGTISVTADGVGTAMAEAFSQGHDVRPYAEMFSTGLWAYWMASMTELNKDIVPYMSMFEAARATLRQNNIANGVERVLYILNDDVHCLSPTLKDYHVRNPEQMLQAFNEIVQRNPSATLVDPHIISFLSVKDGRLTDAYIFDLSSKDPVRRIIGLMRVIAMTQKSYNLTNLEGLSNWCVDYAQPVLRRYHDKAARKELSDKMENLRNKGDLKMISDLLGSTESFEHDIKGFRRAMAEYKHLQAAGRDLQNRLDRPDLFGRTKGRETAAYVGTILASFIIMIFVFLYMSGQQPF